MATFSFASLCYGKNCRCEETAILGTNYCPECTADRNANRNSYSHDVVINTNEVKESESVAEQVLGQTPEKKPAPKIDPGVMGMLAKMLKTLPHGDCKVCGKVQPYGTRCCGMYVEY